MAKLAAATPWDSIYGLWGFSHFDSAGLLTRYKETEAADFRSG